MINLQLTIEQVNSLLAVLSSRPYGEVHQLIQTIVEQGEPQAKAFAESKKDLNSIVKACLVLRMMRFFKK